MPPDAPAPRAAARLPAGIWVLGGVSLLMDISSEMIHALLPLFLVGSLGVSVLALGLIEGLAEAIALVVKVFSGAWSDRLGQRKPLALAGYALGALAKPGFALAQGVGLVVAARWIDRIGKGIRGAPRDALVADIAPPSMRGAAYGLRQSLDTVGAFIGPLLATALMLAWNDDFRAVFWVACVPAVLSVLLLAVGVREPAAHAPARQALPLDRAALAHLSRAYWQVVAVGAIFTLARFSEAFLVLRAAQLGVPTAWIPLVMVAMSAVYAATAYPCGRWSDRDDGRHRRTLLMLGMAVLVAADLLLAVAEGWWLLGAGVALWGVHMGLTQGLLAAMVADAAPADRRGTAFGVFHLASGVAMLAASVIAGALWHTLGATAAFGCGAALAAASLAALLAWGRHAR